ncbi:hypothetical protein A2926_01635 [Candidatus Giovannonibacteria bacterium RIFCSPLOWO2_01_FULL_44_40]|uniref:DUF5671 domain-containing protein n=1 Tax=Candidatus Giovannonibacteria bacterium RIFCSPHIGHO2_01_FULL_45_23 TaxID=1798325 RepID=A0A1F5VF46_9BACT|nr:MAG: hypothetical protein A2834_01825 [Candidatus Giovannonibacteria bacterium RIFCSPHIGHO2_01_FULL_45_23]OGF75111.1 MAG: hypothetical protein A3C77_01045 [Candidatus Giovannonibacteria bacterium RIFCSPHIGHO2_02_FULL_45_13]OGF79865.1 MAG: hypothetical protein A2926_01635 [Candidatus Giovannonibacteria bacterium RIFCSPLOWO2_01_FULL_44_40]
METKTGPKDVFLHLLSSIALYVSAGSFAALIFNYVNVLLPDTVSDNYYSLLAAYSAIRWSLAILIVVFPVYVWSVWFLNKSYAASPEKREMKIRKWLLYFTLFAAGIIVIGDFVTLIYNFLQGELTLRFSLKILAVFAVAGGIFGYYILDIKNKAPQKIFAYAASFVMLIAIIAGFFVAGSPKEERARRFDDQRIQHLQMIQSEIINFWIKKAALPKTLDELNDPIRGVVIPKDPETNAAYIYEIKDKENFKLCAAFNLPSFGSQGKTERPFLPDSYYGALLPAENWQHDVGYTCFDRKIDKDLYKPEKTR